MVLGLFFVLPLALVVVVSFWDYTEYSLIPDVILMNYEELFYGCFDWSEGLCTTFATYLSTFKYVFLDMVFHSRDWFCGRSVFGFLRPQSKDADRFVSDLYDPVLD